MRNGSRATGALLRRRITHLPRASVAQREERCATFENNERNTRAEAIISQLIRCRDQVSLMQRRDANTRSCVLVQSYKKSQVGEWAGGNSK
jgi:hypothetical protein